MFLSKFRLIILLATVLCVWLLPSSAKAQEIHALLVIMDSDATLGSSVKIDDERIRGFLKGKVDRIYNTHITTLYSSAGETTAANIQQEIRALRPGRDDVVFFYFSGHGGMISETDRRTFLGVSDPANPSGDAKLLRDDLETYIDEHNCRLKLIITDCCSNYPMQARSKNYVTFATVRGTTTKTIRDLFGAHKGLLHVNAATEAQYGWGTNRIGGIFTEALILSIAEDSDKSGDGFIEWSEVLTVAKKITNTRWKALGFGDRLKSTFVAQGLDPDQITVQTPKVYSAPSRTQGKTTEISAGLWQISNSYSYTGVSLEINKGRYRVEDILTLTVRPKRNCYLTVLNWGPSGNLTQLFPNKFDQNNRLQGGKEYTLPPSGANYEIFLGERGTERLKILAVADKRVSEKINQVLSYSDNPKDPFRGHLISKATVQEAATLVSKEEEIEKILKGLDTDDWGEDHIETTVR